MHLGQLANCLMTVMMIEQSYKSNTIALQLSQSCDNNSIKSQDWQRMHDRVLNRTKAPRTEPIQSALTTGEHCKSPR